MSTEAVCPRWLSSTRSLQDGLADVACFRATGVCIQLLLLLIRLAMRSGYKWPLGDWSLYTASTESFYSLVPARLTSHSPASPLRAVESTKPSS